MKTRKFVSILIFVLAVLFFSQCATTPKYVIFQGEPLSNEKAYLAGVFSYSCVWIPDWLGTDDPHFAKLRLKGDNKKKYYMYFPRCHRGYERKIYGPPTPRLRIIEVEPGEYKAESITKTEEEYPRITEEDYPGFPVFTVKTIMQIPPKLRGNITAERGSVTYLGDFSIKRHYNVFFLTVRFESSYVYDFKKFQNKIGQEYIVPENFKLKKL
jgi:hypothetical protein